MTILTRSFTPEAIDRPVAGCSDDPPRRAWRQSGVGPLLHRNRERVLDCLLGNVDVTEGSNQYRNGAAVLFAEYTFDLGAFDCGNL